MKNKPLNRSVDDLLRESNRAVVMRRSTLALIISTASASAAVITLWALILITAAKY